MISSHCCGFYSATGAIFMLYVYVMLMKQPAFITGIDDLEEARNSAFGAMITFCVTFALSLLMIAKGKGESEGREYDTGEEGNNRLNIDLKTNYGSVPTESY